MCVRVSVYPGVPSPCEFFKGRQAVGVFYSVHLFFVVVGFTRMNLLCRCKKKKKVGVTPPHDQQRGLSDGFSLAAVVCTAGISRRCTKIQKFHCNIDIVHGPSHVYYTTCDTLR